MEKFNTAEFEYILRLVIAAACGALIGFLGAGMIFVHKKTVTGLTTAAGIGMAIGSGMFLTGGAAFFRAAYISA